MADSLVSKLSFVRSQLSWPAWACFCRVSKRPITIQQVAQCLKPQLTTTRHKCYRHLNLYRLIGGGCVLLSAIPVFPLSSTSNNKTTSQHGALQSNATSLSHRELVKNAAAVVVDSSCVLLTHAALAVMSLHQEYAKMVEVLKLLLDDHAKFVGSPSREDKLWQDIIHQRVDIDDKKIELEEANAMLVSAISVMERAAEAAYQADCELSALTAGQHMQLVQTQLDSSRKVGQRAEEELTKIQVKIIESTTEYDKR